MAKKLSKKIVYTVSAKLIFDSDEDVNITEYLDKLREIGVAEVVDVDLVDEDDIDEEE